MVAARGILAVVTLLVINHAFAADANRAYRVRAIDAVATCAALNHAKAKVKQQDDWGDLYGFSLYTQGYLTAINRMAYDTYDIAGRKNTKTVMVWLEGYCKEHPEDSFDLALSRMVAEIYPQRRTVATKSN
ncbi:MAG: hypothetical protein R3E50_01665 [Halioglobus sp.]